MLKVKKLDPRATLPTVAHPGEDLAYDLYALEDTILELGKPVKVSTGIAAQASQGWDSSYHFPAQPLGLLIRDRSSMAAKGIMVSGGVIDHGYTGEIIVMLTLIDRDRIITREFTDSEDRYTSQFRVPGYEIKKGDKIAQMIPIQIFTGLVIEVAELEQSARGANGFGSTGK